MKKIFFFSIFLIFNLNICNDNLFKNIYNLNNTNTSFYRTLYSGEIYNTKRNVILAVIQTYSLSTVLPFFKSLIKSNIQNCDTVIFVRDVSHTLINYLKNIGVFIYEIPNEYKNVPILNLRWKLYIDFLKETKNYYHLVFCTDVRDTLFQKDVFKFYENHKSFLGVALEDGTLTEKTNKIWIINFVGKEKHKIIQNERIICFGTMWGTVDKFLEFSKIFWEKLINNSKYIDQGIGNYLFYYENLFKNYIVKSDNYGPVMTIALTPPKNIILDKDNNILNFKGEIAAVVHQYDRKPDLVKLIRNKYCKELIKNFSVNETKYNNDFRETIKLNHLMENNKYYRNILFFFILLEIFTFILLLKSIYRIKKRRK